MPLLRLHLSLIDPKISSRRARVQDGVFGIVSVVVPSAGSAHKRASARQGLEQPRRIARHLIDFDIDARAGLQRAERGDLQGVGDDQH